MTASDGSILSARNAPRLAAALLVMTFYSATISSLIAGLHGNVGPGGAPLFYDWAAFRQAGAFALEGKAALAYDDARMIAAEQAAFPAATTRLPWSYPPTFQLLLAPFAALPYGLGFAAFNLVLCGLYLLAARPWTQGLDRVLAVLAPGVFVNLFFGQNGLLTVSLLAIGVQHLERRPILAGVVLGLLAYKPQFALVAPIVLVATGAWRALGAAALSQALFVAASAALLGPECWTGFIVKALHPAAVVSGSSSAWTAVPSLGVLGRELGLGTLGGGILQGLGAVFALSAVVLHWRREPDARLRAASLGAATLLVAPYLRAYDFILLLPFAAAAGRADARAPVASAAALVAWLSPVLLMFFGGPWQYGPVIALMALVMTTGPFRPLSPAASERG